ncbi:MAG: bifunctional precorrin-2 dehydrogenase/sirohydrochlorin ferrochelatase [Chloroflexi bacterium]|nr:MAG: bifunctional precorrin-2 dehydrogenase/sirohydrochlorin ferrochelatase [Chloroflexota bacterium]
MDTYPIGLIGLENRRVVVIGGGSVAARKVSGLLDAGARVEVISPYICEKIRTLAGSGSVLMIERAYQPGDLTGAFLAIAATDDPAANHAVWEEANIANCQINVVDDPKHSTFILPAVIRRGDVTISISTGGASPALARRLREKLEPAIVPEYAELAQILAELRPDLIKEFPSEQERLSVVSRIIDSDLLRMIGQEGSASAREYARKLISDRNDSIVEDRT